MKIRLYTPQDYEMLKEWWVEANEPPPPESLIPETAYILEDRGTPVMSLALYLTNCKVIGYLECFIKNPMYYDSHVAADKLIRYVENEAKKHGCQVLVGLTYQDKLKKRYQDLGYVNTVNNLSSFARKIE